MSIKYFFLLLVSLVTFSCKSLTKDELDIVNRIGFDVKIVQELKRDIGSGFERSYLAHGISFKIPNDRFYQIVNKYYGKYKSNGYLLYRSRIAFDQSEYDYLTVINSKDSLDVVRTMLTDGINYGLDNSAILAKIREWHDQYGFFVVGAGRDWLEGIFTYLPNNIDLLANEINNFCPDAVIQGTQLLGELKQLILEGRYILLWWD